MISKILSVLLLSVSAMAIDTARCPSEISFDAKVEKVYKNSIHSKTPGWKEAQSSLVKSQPVEALYTLTHKTVKGCFYQDENQSEARLVTASFHDPEEWNPVLEDRLVVNFKIDKSSYVTFLPIRSYGRNYIKAYSSPFSLKVKTELFIKERNRAQSFDLGMISVDVK